MPDKSIEDAAMNIEVLQRREAERKAIKKPDGRGLRDMKRKRQDNLSLKVTRETTLALHNIGQATGDTFTEIVERLIIDHDKKMRGVK